jgi:hypothetical protein
MAGLIAHSSRLEGIDGMLLLKAISLELGAIARNSQ